MTPEPCGPLGATIRDSINPGAPKVVFVKLVSCNEPDGTGFDDVLHATRPFELTLHGTP